MCKLLFLIYKSVIQIGHKQAQSHEWITQHNNRQYIINVVHTKRNKLDLLFFKEWGGMVGNYCCHLVGHWRGFVHNSKWDWIGKEAFAVKAFYKWQLCKIRFLFEASRLLTRHGRKKDMDSWSVTYYSLLDTRILRTGLC